MRVQDTAATASAAAITAGPPRAFPKPPTNAGPKALAIVEAASPQFQAEIAVVNKLYDECIPTSHSDVSYVTTQQSIREPRQM